MSDNLNPENRGCAAALLDLGKLLAVVALFIAVGWVLMRLLQYFF